MTTYLAQFESLFISPALAAAGAAAIGIPIAIHLLSRFRRQPVQWGAMRFLIEAYRKHRRRMQLEQWLLLLVRCLVVLLLGLALAQPLLGGLLSRLTGGLDVSGRVVHLVIDDSLSTRTLDALGQTRFARQQELAGRVLDALEPGDAVALWRAGRPAEQILRPTADRSAVRAQLEAMQPGFARSDVPAALASVLADVRSAGVGPDRTVVVLISDFPRGAGYLSEPGGETLTDLGRRARVFVSQPSAEATNIQIARLSPARSRVLADDPTSASIPVTLRVTRFDGASLPAEAEAQLSLMKPAGTPLGQFSHTVHFAPGQSEVQLNLQVPVDAAALPGGGVVGERVVLQARLSPGSASASLRNALPADDVAWAAVELRQRLRVAIIDEPASLRTGAAGTGLTPAQWLSFALSPQVSGDRGVVETRILSPASLSSGQPENIDAAFVTRPEGLDAAGWTTLTQFARRGGLVWVFAPADPTPAPWWPIMQRHFELDWRLDFAVVTPPDLGGLSTETPTPEPLGLLAADWEALLRPVRLAQAYPLVTPAATDAWLATEAVGDEPPLVLLAGRRVGRGEVMLMPVPLASDWTNLPTKPLFVPLLHETLRGVLGEAPAASATLAAGQTPDAAAAVLRRMPAKDVPDSLATAMSESVSGSAPIRQPGVYLGGEDASDLIIVGPDAPSGDTRETSEQALQQWLAAFGPGRWAMLPASDPGSALSLAQSRVSLGWPLLWAVLALLLLETVLARTASRASKTDRPTLARRAARALHLLRHEDDSPKSRAA